MTDTRLPDRIALSNAIANIVIERMGGHVLLSKRYGIADDVIALIESWPGVAAALRQAAAIDSAVWIDGWGTMEFRTDPPARMDDAESVVRHLRAVGAGDDTPETPK